MSFPRCFPILCLLAVPILGPFPFAVLRDFEVNPIRDLNEDKENCVACHRFVQNVIREGDLYNEKHSLGREEFQREINDKIEVIGKRRNDQ